MNITEARKIVAAAARAAKGLGSVGSLVDELERYDDLEDVVLAEQTVRTLDDLAGYYDGGRFVGGRKIAEALRLTRSAGDWTNDAGTYREDGSFVPR